MIVLIALAGIGCRSHSQSATKVDRPKAVDLYVRGFQEYQHGDNRAAVASLKKATKANPNLRMAHSLLGDLYRSSGDYDQALVEYETITRLDPYASTNQFRLGLTYQLLHRLQDAAAAYLRALKLDPQDPKINMNLGLVYLALDQKDDAVKYLDRASQLAPDSPEVWSNLGVCYDAKGNAVLAEAAYKKSLELDSKRDSTYVNLGSNLVTQGKATEAITTMEEAVKRIDVPPVRKRYGDAFAVGKRYEEAIQQYDLVLKKDPNFYPALNEKGMALIKLYQRSTELDDPTRKAALEVWKKSLALNPDQPRIQAAVKKWEAR